jgi:hypothetical protein
MSQTLTLRDWPDEWVTLACHDCDRKGRYRKERLIEQFGADAELPELRHQIAQCPRRHAQPSPCGVYFPDLMGRGG